MARLAFGRRYTASLSAVPKVGHSASGRSGNSRFIADGRIIAPDSRCEPVVLPFSTSAIGTSPSDSSIASSSASSCVRRIAQASPAGPPPTITTPTSIRSSSGSVGGPTNSFAESTGGGNSTGAVLTFLSLFRLHGVCELRQDLVEVADHAEVRELEDRGVRVLVDRDDVLGVLHADLVLDGPRDPGRQVELRRDRLAGLADLGRVRVPAGVHHRAGGGHCAAERVGQLLGELEALGLAESAAAGDQDLGVLDVHVGAALLAALDHLRLRRVLLELDVDVDHLGRAVAALGDVEGVEAADDDAGLAHVADVHDRGVLEDRPLGDKPAVPDLHRGDLHGHAGVQARRQAGADLEAEQAAAEQRVLEAVVLDDLRHHVDDRLGEALGRLGPEDLRGAVPAERGAQVVGQVVAVADHDGGALAAQLLCQLRALGHGAERVLVELALVVECVDEDAHLCGTPFGYPAGHASSFLSSSQLTIFSTVSFVSSSSMISPASFWGGGLISRTVVREPCSPTRSASIPTSAADLVSSCFFFAPMIAFSDG